MNAIAPLATHYRFAGNVPDPDDGPGDSPADRFATSGELPDRIELWDQTGSFVERFLAMTSHINIGCAAYEAAASEYPDRQITLRGALYHPDPPE